MNTPKDGARHQIDAVVVRIFFVANKRQSKLYKFIVHVNIPGSKNFCLWTEFFSSSRIFFLEILEFSTVLEILNESSHSGHSHYFFQLAKQKATTDAAVLHQVQESVPLAPMICQIQVTKGLEPVP